MAFICDKSIPCSKCEHYRIEKDKERKVCFAEDDTQKAMKNCKKGIPCYECSERRWDPNKRDYICFFGKEKPKTTSLPSLHF